ncbi:MAG: hypothetical protein Q8Q85_03420 [Gemmatimonadales bacterium]|nr:hypothetical protein [Gemmatimonadales bacterium]
MNELPTGLAKALAELDAKAQRSAARVDAERVAARVLARLNQEPEAPATLIGRVLSAPRGLRVAAAASLVIVAGTVTMMGVRSGGHTASVVVTLPVSGVDSLDQSEAEAVLRVVDQVRAVNATVPRASAMSVDDLSEPELRALLQAMQSKEGAI